MNLKFIYNLLFIYLFLAPVNWLPFIPLDIFNSVKSILFVIIFCYVLFKNKFSAPSFLLSFGGLLLILFFSYFGILQGIMEENYANIKDIVLIYLMIWLIYNIKISEDDLLKIFQKTVIVMAIITALSFLSALTGFPSWVSPEPWLDPFSKGAFGGYRTGWSNSLFLFVPFILYYSNIKFGKTYSTFTILTLSFILISQVLSGGRAGLIASILSLTLFSSKNILLFIFTSLILVGAAYFIPEDILLEQMRAERLKNEKISYEDIDRISSGRYEGYVLGLELFEKSPIFGIGFGQSEEETEKVGYGVKIHNTFLIRLIEGGLIYVIPLIILLIHIHNLIRIKISETIINVEKAELKKLFFNSLFFSAIFISFVEPNYLIGSFQGEAFFWACIGYLLKNDFTHNSIHS